MDEQINDEIKRIAKGYAGHDYDRLRMVTEQAFAEYGEASWRLPDFLAILNEAVSAIPESARAGATVDLRGGYDESTVLEISFERQETAEEVADRVARAHAYAHRRLADERRQYEALRAKFG